MESTTLEQEKNSDFVLYDMLDDIFKYLDIESLRNASMVSRSWNHFAKRRIAKRPVFRVVLPVLYNTEEPEFKAGEYFTTKPNTVLMFCGPHPTMRPVLSLEYAIMGEYHERMPSRMVMLGVNQVLMDTTEVLSCGNTSYSRAKSSAMLNQILGLFMSEREDMTVEIVECVSHEKNTDQKGAYIFNKLHAAAAGVEHPIFLLFSRSGYTIGSHVMRRFNERYAGKPVSLWGSTIPDYIKRNDDGYPSYLGTHGFLGILLHGPRVRAHCLVLTLPDEESSILKRLAEFAGTFNHKKSNVGLVCGLKDYSSPYSRWVVDEDLDPNNTKKNYNSEDMMKMVKSQLPSIEFIGMFNDRGLSIFGCDHMSKNGDYHLEHQVALSIMILTYN